LINRVNRFSSKLMLIVKHFVHLIRLVFVLNQH